MAAAKIRVSDIAKRMGKSEKDVIFQLQSLGADVTDPSQIIEPEVIQALITGKKLTTRTRSVIMREDKPEPVKGKKEVVRPPRPIVKPAVRAKAETPKEEAPAAPQPPPVIIPEFVQAAEAEERAAKEAPTAPETRKVAAQAPAIAGGAPRPSAGRVRPSGATGPRSRAPQGTRPNYAGQPSAVRSTPMTERGRPAQRAPMGARPAAGARSGAPMGTRPAGAGMRAGAGPGLRSAGAGRPMPMPPPAMPGALPTRRKKSTDEIGEERQEKKKPAGKGVKKTRELEVDAELFTKGPFSGTQIIADDLGPDIILPEPSDEEAEKPKTPSARRDTRKQAAPVSAKVLEFKKPTGKVALTEGVTVKELADKLGVKANDLMKHLLMKKGLMVSINQPLGADLALEIAKDLEIEAEVVSFETAADLQAIEKTASTGTTPRGPVITVMGHVDHGKTSLLDAIRETNVAAGEAGGITQHIGAYQVEERGPKIVFLDTPGHEAFTLMRARGAKVTDIVVLVVAADDGVMPQTKEAIDHARAAKVSMIVAINKIDKPNGELERVKRQLTENSLMPAEWGGDTEFVEVSAKKKIGIEKLLETILLVADLRELKANPDAPATGTVLESRVDKGRGPVATILVQNGTLKAGDFFICGSVFGKVRAMFDDRGRVVNDAPPSTPVEVLGLQGVPDAGDLFQVTDEAKARHIVEYRQNKQRDAAMARISGSRITLDQLHEQLKAGDVKELGIVIKGDVQGSVEVLSEMLPKLSTDQVKLKIIGSGVGAVTENDVLLASASSAIVIAFGVRPDRKALDLAQQEHVDIRTHNIIYEVSDELKKAMEGLLEPVVTETYLGRAEVRNTFRVKGAGTIAGCYVVDGILQRAAQVRVLRDGAVIYTSKLNSLKRFKDDASEVRTGFECGAGVANFNDIKVGDVLECFSVTKMSAAEAAGQASAPAGKR